MKRHRRIVLTLCTIALGLVSAMSSCESYRPSDSNRKTSTLGNPNREETVFAVAKYGQLSQLSVCIKELVLTNAGGEISKVPYSPVQEIVIPMSGADLSSLNVPPGQYTAISLELSDVCGQGRSISISNSQGQFASSSNLPLKFSGNEFVGGSLQKIIFDIQSLAAQLSQVNSNSGILAIAASSTGDYRSVSCGMQGNMNDVAFCETFTQSSNDPGRGGQLSAALWTVARAGNLPNQGQGEFNIWHDAVVDACGTNRPASAQDGSDLTICNGQLRQAVRDDATMIKMTISPNQPFDFTGRTGTLSFDITNDTNYGVWPELWISDQYIPGAQTMWSPVARAKNGIGIRFAGSFAAGSGGNAPGCSNSNQRQWIVDTIQLVRNYNSEEVTWGAQDPRLTTLGCVVASQGSSGKMNHIELRVKQNEIEIWASDAGSPSLKRIALLQNINLPFSQGYLTFGNHHNHPAAQGNAAMTNHTYAWDNIAFDGPKVKRDVVAGVLDNSFQLRPGVYNLGYQSLTASPLIFSTLPISATDVQNTRANGRAVITANFTVPYGTLPSTIQYSVNGVQLSAPIPFAISLYERYAIELPVPATALQAGSQSISIWAGDNLILSNIDIRLIGVGL